MARASDPAERLHRFVAPVTPTDPVDDPAAFRSLDALLADDPIVGLGESTHGTSEFFASKRHLIRHLVEERGVRLLALEAGFAETRALDQYVVQGEGDPQSALGELGFWMYETREARELVEWLRSFNRGRPLEDSVRVYGVDHQFTAGAASAVDRYLRTVDPDYRSSVVEGLEVLADESLHGAGKDAVDAATGLVADLADRFDRRRDEYASRSSRSAWERTRQHVRVLGQACEYRDASGEESRRAGAVRDEYMAENVSWVLRHEDRNAAAIWAHNGHVARGDVDDGWRHRPMGAHLADRYGDRYRAVGFEFDAGSFRAVHATDDEEPGLATFTVDELSETVGEWLPERDADDRVDVPAVTLPEALASTPGENVLLDLNGAASDRALRDWFERGHPLHSIGAVFDPADRSAYARVCDPAAAFDALLFVRTASATAGIPEPS